MSTATIASNIPATAQHNAEQDNTCRKLIEATRELIDLFDKHGIGSPACKDREGGHVQIKPQDSSIDAWSKKKQEIPAVWTKPCRQSDEKSSRHNFVI